MKILKAKIDWMEGYANDPQLKVLVDSIPDHADLQYEERSNCYFAEKDGYVNFFHYKSPGEGYAGRHFEIRLTDGSTKVLKGPWSSRCSVMNALNFTPSLEVAITSDPDCFERGYTYFSGALTIDRIKEALLLTGEKVMLEREDIDYRYPGLKGEFKFVIKKITSSQHISNPLQEIKDDFDKGLFGMTVTEAHEKHICIDCKESMSDKLDETIDKKEYLISGLCNKCFDKATKED